MKCLQISDVVVVRKCLSVDCRSSANVNYNSTHEGGAIPSRYSPLRSTPSTGEA